MIKNVLAAATRGRAAAALAGLAERFDDGRPNVLRVLTYHRVDRPEARPTLNPRLISASPEAFAAQMAILAARYRVVSLADVLAAARSESRLPPRAVLVTFDDACRDFAEHAWPVMRRLGLPATVFVPTAYPDRPEYAFWWDRLYHAVTFGAFPDGLPPVLDPPLPPPHRHLATSEDRARAYTALSRRVKALPHAAAMTLVDDVCAAAGLGERRPEPAVLGWDALRGLAAEGVTLAPHTRTHPLLHRVPGDVARGEIAGAVEDLRREIGTVPAALAYPDGGYDSQTLSIAGDAGIEAAFTTRSGINRFDAMAPADRLRLRRINVGGRVTPAVFRARLVAWPRPFSSIERRQLHANGLRPEETVT